jgi:hypothetical protein
MAPKAAVPKSRPMRWWSGFRDVVWKPEFGGTEFNGLPEIATLEPEL